MVFFLHWVSLWNFTGETSQEMLTWCLSLPLVSGSLGEGLSDWDSACHCIKKKLTEAYSEAVQWCSMQGHTLQVREHHFFSRFPGVRFFGTCMRELFGTECTCCKSVHANHLPAACMLVRCSSLNWDICCISLWSGPPPLGERGLTLKARTHPQGTSVI